MPVPQTIIASPGASSGSGELDGCDPSPLTQSKRCVDDADLSHHRFGFSFDSEHPALRKSSKSGINKRQAASHRRFATPIQRASHAHTNGKPKFYHGTGPIEEASCSDKNEGLTIDTSAAQQKIERRRLSSLSSDENLHLHQDQLQSLPDDRCLQSHGCLEWLGDDASESIMGLVARLHGSFALRQG